MRLKKPLALLLALALLIFIPQAQIDVRANDKIQALQDQIEALEAKKKAAQDRISNIQDEREREIANRNAIVTEIDSTVQQISLLQEKINEISD